MIYYTEKTAKIANFSHFLRCAGKAAVLPAAAHRVPAQKDPGPAPEFFLLFPALHGAAVCHETVSYTHLTLPTILRV